MSGYEIRDPNSSGRYALNTKITGYRNRSCIGTINIQLSAWNIAGLVQGSIVGNHVVGWHVVAANDPNNLNQFAVQVVQELIDEM